MDLEKSPPAADATVADEVSTLEASRLLGLAVRSVQLMVDRGELQAWKTPGGHRRISRESVLRWREGERQALPAASAPALPARPAMAAVSTGAPRVLLIEDSIHFQNLVSLVVQQHFPQVELLAASDAVTGLVMTGEFHPDVLIVDILLPVMDGPTLVASLRANPRFSHLQVIVITSLDASQRQSFAFALQGLPVIHKSVLALELPEHLRHCLAALAPQGV